MKKIISCIALSMLTACAAQPSQQNSIYNTPPVRAGVISQVTIGQIISIRPVLISGGTSYIGTATGAAVGAIAGSSLGQRKGSAIAGIFGGVLGGAIGSSVQQGIQNQPGIEMIIATADRRTIAIDQPNYGETFYSGDIVKIINSYPVRVTH